MVKRLIFFLILMVLFPHASLSINIYNGTDPQQIALTFDDGPSFKFTPKVLDILKVENIKATFFITGHKVEQYPEIFERIVKEGHCIGNHTYNHSSINLLNNEKLNEEIKMTSDIVFKASGKRLVYFRPPHGLYFKSQRKLIEDEGYKFIMWSVNADDFYHIPWGIPTSQAIEKRVLKGIKGGDIILAHDNSQQLVDALPVIIKELKSRGYDFVTLSNMAGVN
jgi:peptidoglycan/xylan/chitin deacetylase (PgdA/CDA1 family)